MSFDRRKATRVLAKAAQVDRKLLHDLGFSIQGGPHPDDDWAFLRTGSNALFDARESRLAIELDRLVANLPAEVAGH